MAATARLSRLLNDRIEPGQTSDLPGAVEATRFTDLSEQMAGENRPDAADLVQRLAALISPGETAQLRVEGGDLRLERGHHR
jgi:hypothetical protein